MRALFFGTPDIAVPSLDALASMADVVGVVCQPDKPAGRGLALRSPPVKERALALGLPVVQPTKVRTEEFARWVSDQLADVALVIAYGRILPKAVLEGPRRVCVNLHASILPKYRGAAPITWAVVDGEVETGVSLMQMDEGMDTGPVYAIERVPIGPDTTAGELSLALGACAAELTRTTLSHVVRGELEATPQDHASATHARMLTKEDGRIAWASAAANVHDHVRGMTPWPGAFTTFPDGNVPKTFKVLATRRSELTSGGAPPGTVIEAGKNRVVVACGEGCVEIVRGQLEGKKPLGASELVGGRTLTSGMRLGEGA